MLTKTLGPIYFLDNTQESDWSSDGYIENDKRVIHNHDNLREMNESNTTLIIDGKQKPFKKFFTPKQCGTYLIKLVFKNKLSNCAYMFCQCKNIIEIDFSKFNTENVINMQSMFEGCSQLKSLDLKFFKTEKVTNMYSMFACCSSLVSLDLRTFNTEKVTNVRFMFGICTSLSSLNLSSFNTQKITDMRYMFEECYSLTTLNLSSFDTHNVTEMGWMFSECSSLKTINLSSFNEIKADITGMFNNCRNLTSCGSSNKRIIDEFNRNKNTNNDSLFKYFLKK